MKTVNNIANYTLTLQTGEPGMNAMQETRRETIGALPDYIPGHPIVGPDGWIEKWSLHPVAVAMAERIAAGRRWECDDEGRLVVMDRYGLPTDCHEVNPLDIREQDTPDKQWW